MTLSSASQGLKGKNDMSSKAASKALPEEKTSRMGLAQGYGVGVVQGKDVTSAKCANKRPSHIDGKRLLNSVVSVLATNRKQGEAADGIGTRVVTCLINKWKVRINREGLYNVKAYAPKRGPEMRVPKKNIKLHGQDPRTTLAHFYASTMSPMTNHYPATKAQPFSPRSTNYIVWALNVRTQYHFGVVTN